MKPSFTVLTLLAGLSLSGAAQATLMDRGGGLIYDTDLDITWLADANYAMTQFTNSGGTLGDADGLMTWSAATTWASDLVYGGYDDWRLPTSLNADGTGPCIGYNCTGSEMGHLFYTEGGLSEGSILASTILDDYFINMQSSIYWSGTEFNTSNAWSFYTRSGLQRPYDDKSNSYYALAVRPGDVAAVPEPATLGLLALGLAGLGVMRRRRG